MKGLGAAAVGFFVAPFLLIVAITGGFEEPNPAAANCDSPVAVGETLANSAEFTTEMAENAAIIIDAGQIQNISPAGQHIALATALADSGLINTQNENNEPTGLFNQPPSQDWGTAEQINDPAYSAIKFYEILVAVEEWETAPPGEVAQAVQRTTTPEPYTQTIPDARRIYAELTDQTEQIDCTIVGETTGDQIAVTTATGATITVDESLAPALQQLLNDAAEENIIFGGWGWRDPATQIRLRREHCGPTQYDINEKPSSQCRPPTARPGRSQHEIGLAIDFTCNGATIRSRNSACFIWLKNNAARYGLKNLPSEPWHWSTTGR